MAVKMFKSVSLHWLAAFKYFKSESLPELMIDEGIKILKSVSLHCTVGPDLVFFGPQDLQK